MSQTTALIQTLKHTLRSRGYTYARVARHLGLSEASVKRMFSSRHFTLRRLNDICELLQMDFVDLVRLTDEGQAKITSLSLEQEQELVADSKLLLVAICIQNAWSFEDITGYYRISAPECIRHLARLDRLGLIQLLPNNRIKSMVAPDFRWLSQGPIERFFRDSVQAEFLSADFTADGEMRLYLSGTLSRKSIDILNRRLEGTAREFSLLQRDDARLPVTARHNTGLMLATRIWELPAFLALKRETTAPGNG